jgi:hypothetical protein
MIRFIRVLIVAMLLPVSATFAQKNSYEAEKNTITEVKRAPELYVYAEATCKTVDEAEAVVEEMFLENVNEYVAEVKSGKGKSNVVVNDAKSISHEIKMPRGSNMHRVFLYSKKSDIISSDGPIVVVNPAATVEPTVAETAPEVAPTTYDVPAVAKEIAKVKTLKELGTTLPQMKRSGRISNFDKYRNISDPSTWYLVLYDATGTISAVLTDVKSNGERVNVNTLSVDSMEKYQNHAAIGVEIK